MKIFFFALTFGIFCYQCESVELECEYKNDHYGSYYCDVDNDLLITSKDDRDISSIRGQHLDGKSDSDVKYFWSERKVVKFFPRGLTKFFKNIEYVAIHSVGLEEVSKEDLKEFGRNLKRLGLWNNKIEKIDADLFEFNPNLERITLSGNDIKHIGSGAFSRLEKLTSLVISDNPCTSLDYEDDIIDNNPKILELIGKVEESCKDLSATTVKP